MIPVVQKGSTCWLACLASILEVRLEDLPTLEGDCAVATYGRHGLLELQKWLCDRNLYFQNICLSSLPDPFVPPPGYVILSTRVTDNPHEQHSLVVLNGRVVWDPHPKGGAIQPDWDGIIHGRSWQIAEPVSWTQLCVLDPTQPVNVPGAASVPFGQMIQDTKANFDRLFRRKRGGRPGADFGAFQDISGFLAAAYVDAPTEELGRKALGEKLDKLREMVFAMEELRRRAQA